MHKGTCGAGLVRRFTPTWRVFDATDKPVGRLAQTLAKLLVGKHKPIFRPNIDNGDVCVVINAEKVIFPSERWNKKRYFKHTGRPGHYRLIPAHKMLEDKPEEILRRAVKGMMPNNNTRKFRLEKLIICKGPYHPYPLEFAPKEEADQAMKEINANKEKIPRHRHAFVQKPLIPNLWKNYLKYKYSANQKRNAKRKFMQNN